MSIAVGRLKGLWLVGVGLGVFVLAGWTTVHHIQKRTILESSLEEAFRLSVSRDVNKDSRNL